jgi:hypothetical protein
VPGTRRIPLARAHHAQVTARAVHLYRLGLRMRQGAAVRGDWRFSDLVLALHRELNLRPWHPSVFDLDPHDTPADDGMIAQQHEHVRDLLRQLQEAAEAPGGSPMPPIETPATLTAPPPKPRRRAPA